MESVWEKYIKPVACCCLLEHTNDTLPAENQPFQLHKPTDVHTAGGNTLKKKSEFVLQIFTQNIRALLTRTSHAQMERLPNLSDLFHILILNF